ncbi:MAG: sprT domain-containing protein [Arcobacter sp.]|nr:MAG: sprT domain-containing protein [Arcobacter sp.]
MFIHRLKRYFQIIIFVSICFLIYSWYNNYQFSKQELKTSIINQIKNKEQALKNLVYTHYKIHVGFPIIISNELPSNLFGLTSYSKGEIKIYLNKKRFQESLDYMIDDVLPHEYAHAMIFKLKLFSKKKAGHSKEWQRVCKKLQGLRCERFVKNNDIVFGKTNF